MLAAGSRAKSSAFNLSFENIKKMKYKQFVQHATEAEARIGVLTVKECEDLHWDSLMKRSNINPKMPNPSTFIPVYSIDNQISLFPKEVKLWNLNNFSKLESLIHGVCKMVCANFLRLSILLKSIHDFRKIIRECLEF